MRLIKLILKGKKKILLTESLLIIVIFLISSLSFTYYLNNYRSQWIELVDIQDEPDLEIEISEPFRVFLREREELEEELENFQYLSISALPSNLFDFVIENVSIEDFNLFIINSGLLEVLGYELSGNETLLASSVEMDIDLNEIEANFVLESELSNTTTIDICNQTTLYTTIFGSIKTVPFISSADISLILSESYFSELLLSIDESILLNITQNLLSYSFFTFTWSKIELINSLPSKLRRIHKEWMNERISVFFQVYFPEYIQYKEFNLVVHRLFSDKLETLSAEMNSILSSTIIILIFLHLALIALLYNFIRNRMEEFSENSSIFSSRGFQERVLKIHLFELQVYTLLLSLLVFSSIVLLLLYLYRLLIWNFSYLIIGSSTGLLFISFLIMQIKLVQSLDLLTRKVEKVKKSRSRSQMIDISLKIGLGIIFFVALTSILSFNQWFLNIFSVTISSLWIISSSIFGIIALLLFLPTTVNKLVIPLIGSILKHSSKFSSQIFRLFEKLSQQKKAVWTSMIILQLFFSLIIIGPNMYIVHQEQTELSSYCYNISLFIETDSAVEIQELVGERDYMVAYVDTIYELPFRIESIYIYLDNPMSYFNGVQFCGNYFKKGSNSEAFSQLNSSDEFCIISSQKAKENQFTNGDLVNLYKTDVNGSLIVEKKILFDVFNFLPFFSFLFEEEKNDIFISKYNASTHISNVDNHAVFNFQANEESEADAFFVQLREQNILFSIIHSFSQSVLLQEEQQNYALNVLELPIYFLIISIPSLVFLILLNIKNAANQSFLFLIQRGFRRKYAKDLTFYWLIILSTFLTLISFVYSILILFPVIYILNLNYTMPMQLVMNLKLLAILTPILSPVILYLLPVKENKKSKFKFIKFKGVRFDE